MAQGGGWRRQTGALSVLAGVTLFGAALTAAAGFALRAIVPRDGDVAEGLRVDGVPAGPGMAGERFVAERVAARLDAVVALTHEGRVVCQTTVRELGGSVDESPVRRAVQATGHLGSAWQQLEEARAARRGERAFRTRVTLPVEPLAERLGALKESIDTLPTAARWDFERGAATPHADGTAIDAYATAEALVRVLARGGDRVPIVRTSLRPRVTTDVAAAVDRSTLVGRYETRFAFVGGQAGRAQNIARAASVVDGSVLLPGELFSFNAAVGPRSIANGFAQAGEIYKGEMRLGVGGGTCQVASTLYAVSFFAGLEVPERSPHSRPSGYVPPGLDATVAYPDVDLKLRNPFPFPLLVRAELEPGLLAFELLGRARLASVELASATIKVTTPARKVREASWLAEGRVVRKQKGSRGLTIAKTRTIRFVDGTERIEQSRDVYPPADEIYLIPVGGDPAELLPPLPTEPGEAGVETASADTLEAGRGAPGVASSERLALTAENGSP